MKMLSKHNLQLLLAATGVCIFANTLHATTVSTTTFSEECNLNDTCKVPGNDGGKTNFVITPKTGTKYQCNAKTADGSKMLFWVSADKEFSLESGGGPYTAEPEVKMNISGRFKHPNDETAVGYITFTRLPLTAEGEVTCKAAE